MYKEMVIYLSIQETFRSPIKYTKVNLYNIKKFLHWTLTNSILFTPLETN